MYYIEVLRTSRVFWRYLIVVAGIYVLAAVLVAIFHGVGNGVANSSEGIRFSAGGHAAGVAFICLLFASILGSSLSRHLDHLDFALTKPRSRSAFVASVLGSDALGLTAFFIATAIAVFIFHVGLGETHPLVFDAASWFAIVLSFGSVLAWYAIVQAVSCARDAAGWAVAGVWVAGLGLNILGAFTLVPGLHALIAALNFINPIAYLTIVPFAATTGVPLSLAVHAVAIYVVTAAAALIALVRWQHVEA